MTEHRPKPARREVWRHPLRWIERVILGVMMTAVAFVVERKLLKSIREGGASAKRKLEQDESA